MWLSWPRQLTKNCTETGDACKWRFTGNRVSRRNVAKIMGCSMKNDKSFVNIVRKAVFAVFIWLLLLPHEALAYIGPGAGFAVVSSFFILFLTGFVAFFAILAWPFRALMRRFKVRKILKHRRVRRAVVLGLDGMDPVLTTRFMDEGKLPNFSLLRDKGSFRDLKTTTPSISPVAWSTFATGVNPGKHRIFDFYTRDPRNYLPALSSVLISSYQKVMKFGPIRIPRLKVSVRSLRKSTSFWRLLGEQGVFCCVLRVPITFPPEKFYGTCLSAMCAPDLRGTQRSFTLFSLMKSETSEESAGLRSYGGSTSGRGHS